MKNDASKSAVTKPMQKRKFRENALSNSNNNFLGDSNRSYHFDANKSVLGGDTREGATYLMLPKSVGFGGSGE